MNAITVSAAPTKPTNKYFLFLKLHNRQYRHYYFHDSRLIWYSSIKSLMRKLAEDAGSAPFYREILAGDCINLLLKPKLNESVQHGYDADTSLCII